MSRFYRFTAFALFIIASLTLALRSSIHAEEIIPLIENENFDEVWGFGNGPEFPGATGSISLDNDITHGKNDSLKLVGDFTGGGGYVQAGRAIDNIDIRELSFWIRSPIADRLTIRIIDASGQCHQIAMKMEPSSDWQQMSLPLERFFSRRGQADAPTGIVKYESWSGAKDGMWHGPATAVYLLIGNGGSNVVKTVWLSEINITPRPQAVAGAEIKTSVKLDEIIEGSHEWKCSLGREFPGAEGGMTVVDDQPTAGKSCLKVSADFNAGGAYVAAIRQLGNLNVADVTAFRMKVKTENTTSVGIQIVDGSGQTHQRKDVPVKADGKWNDFVLIPTEIAGGEHWGGANDGVWHGPARQVVINLTNRSDEKEKKPTMLVSDVYAEVMRPVFAKSAAFRADFEDDQIGETWKIEGDVAISSKDIHKGSGSLALSRSLEDVSKPCVATGSAFSVMPGQWEVKLSCRSDLNSPDDSYHGVLQLECLNASGVVIDQLQILEIYGKKDWQSLDIVVNLPQGVAKTRLRVELKKAWGRLLLDDLSVSPLAPAPMREDSIDRLLFSTVQLGNLLYPEDSREVGIEVEARKPLPESRRSIDCIVRDYWGAEQMKPVTVKMEKAGKRSGRILYIASIDLSAITLETGRYYELHAYVPRRDGEPFHNYTSFAILPEAVTRKYKPEEVPFTARNWDNRISQYVRLTDRLGIRICGVWGGWSSKPPYKPEAPALDLVRQLGMGWLTTTPVKHIERGSTDWTEEALRKGTRNFLEKYAKERPLIINLGNEPHGTGQCVLNNVAGYRAVYEEVKKFDPSIPVVATSVEPNEEYFRAGYGKWCDAYDFHIYEMYPNVRRTMGEYRELMKKYNVEHPIWSTELGLNSQGMARHEVSIEMIRKFATFFAAGGENVSWFGLLYPDPECKIHGSSGDAHNVFDCRYNRYCPRLDAVTFYHAVGAIAIKKFVDEKQYADGIKAFLFVDRDNRCLQILWKDAGRADVQIPLKGVGRLNVIRIDGSVRTLDAAGEGVTLSITDSPLMLTYENGPKTLADNLDPPVASIGSAPEQVTSGSDISFDVQTQSGKAIDLIAPPFWTIEKSNAEGASAVRFVATPPLESSIHQADFILTVDDSDGRRDGELYYRCPIEK